MYEVAEWLNEDERHCHHVRAILHEENTSIQNVKIAVLARYGLSLLLDNRIQSTERDEVVYHEGIVLAPWVVATKAERFLCIGGANGGILREICNIPTTRRVRLLDVDVDAFRICKSFLPHMYKDVDWDTELDVEFGDISTKLKSIAGSFDIIINDVADATRGAASVQYYTREHFIELKRLLDSEGVLATQAGPAEHLDGEFLGSVLKTLSTIFDYVVPFMLDIPSYGLPWMFILASNKNIKLRGDVVASKLGALRRKPTTFDATTATRAFSLPLQIRARTMSVGRVLTSKSPMLTFRGA